MPHQEPHTIVRVRMLVRPVRVQLTVVRVDIRTVGIVAVHNGSLVLPDSVRPQTAETSAVLH